MTAARAGAGTRHILERQQIRIAHLPRRIRSDGLEHLLGTQFLDAKVYLMSDLPAYVEWPDVLRICAVALGLCTAATLYPAWRAAATQPAEALRHE